MTLLIGQQREVVVYESEIVSLTLQIGASSDPTSVTPSFAVTATTVTDPSDVDWVDGGWTTGTYGDASSSWTYVETPTIGNINAAISISSGHRYFLWVKLPSLSNETPIRLCGTIRCP